METFSILAALVTLSAIASFLNNRFIKLPGTIGVMVVSIVLSGIILFTGKIFPAAYLFIKALTGSIDFSHTLLDIMLAFLLFASALHFDYPALKKQVRPVMILSTVGVVGSTIVFGWLLHYATTLLHIDIPLIYCFLFGALISPTDPVAVLSILKKSKIPPALETIIGGESLLNDAVGLLLFVILKEIADESVANPTLLEGFRIFAQEVFGGLALGGISAFTAYKTMKKVDDFQTIVLVSLSMVMIISVAGGILHVSIPLAAVTAGLILGNTTLGDPRQQDLHEYLERIWKLIDELLNTILFVLIGLQIVVMPFIRNYWLLGCVAIVAVLIARAVSIALPAIFLRRALSATYKSVTILVWAGLRGGISVALALSLPPSPYRELIISGSYCILLFSVIVQGLTLNRVVSAMMKAK
ncbi:sodium/proton antiporter, CPA1 family [Chitinophaga costaii]|uniref:Sodium/proton antiporter, CPA1 family n=1 Tax=Chitinophaga costaii TaxID=1335309 RepID=A0A1C4DU99_9BACT|nr:sodium:proton antiporter [Chitinophaga costaii]PUZ27800.1 sodium:proton antiporter [Chitinophaga costaii]SCC34986.1 sodium/proton antiporter, CPA1 family [Chitinophaga costaii]